MMSLVFLLDFLILKIGHIKLLIGRNLKQWKWFKMFLRWDCFIFLLLHWSQMHRLHEYVLIICSLSDFAFINEPTWQYLHCFLSSKLKMCQILMIGNPPAASLFCFCGKCINLALLRFINTPFCGLCGFLLYFPPELLDFFKFKGIVCVLISELHLAVTLRTNVELSPRDIDVWWMMQRLRTCQNDGQECRRHWSASHRVDPQQLRPHVALDLSGVWGYSNTPDSRKPNHQKGPRVVRSPRGHLPSPDWVIWLEQCFNLTFRTHNKEPFAQWVWTSYPLMK